MDEDKKTEENPNQFLADDSSVTITEGQLKESEAGNKEETKEPEYNFPEGIHSVEDLIDAYKQTIGENQGQEAEGEEEEEAEEGGDKAKDKEADSELAKAKQEAANALAELKTVKAFEIVGGEKEYQSLIKWAQQNLSENETALYDAIMDSGNLMQVQFAVRALKDRRAVSQDAEGSLNTPGTQNHATISGYETMSSMMDALDDPRYTYDESYRKIVDQKVALTQFQY